MASVSRFLKPESVGSVFVGEIILDWCLGLVGFLDVEKMYGKLMVGDCE